MRFWREKNAAQHCRFSSQLSIYVTQVSIRFFV
jgi:hypothetical protein